MSDALVRTITLATATGAGLTAGVFFAFSTFVMKALGTLPPAQGLRAMQAINVAAPNPLFMLALFGTAIGVGALVVTSFGDPTAQASMLRFVAAGAYLVTIGLTITFHVPHNDALALVDPSSAGAAQAWADYRGPWTALNHLRTVGAVIALAVLTWSLRLG